MSKTAPLDRATAAYRRGDYAVALRLVRPLAERGNARAQYNLGVLHDEGRGVRQSHAEAATWYRKAANQGNAEAQFVLGILHQEGQGVRKNFAQAATWFRRAAGQGNAGAQINLGVLYATGKGVGRSPAKAYQWFEIAVSRLPAAEKGARAMATRNCAIAAAKMTPAQIAKARASARAWKPKKK